MAKVKIGFVGVGNMGQCAHLRNYVTIPDCEVVAVAEVRQELAHTVAARYGIPRVYAGFEEMLAHETLDALVASQPFVRHGQLVPALVKSGLPLLTEKPLAGSIEQARTILEALETGSGIYMVGYHKRSDPAIMYAKTEIDRLKTTGELGALRYVRLTMPPGDWIAAGFTDLLHSDDPQPNLPLDPPASDMDAAACEAYVTFVNYYIHQVNLMRHLLGDSYRLTYVAPSEVMLAVESAGGVTGIIEMAPYSTSIDWQEGALVTFERGYVQVDLPAPLASNRPGRVTLFRDPGNGVTPQTIVPTLPWVHAMRQQAINFVQAVKGEAPAPCEAREAMEDLKIARDYIRLVRGV